MSEIHKQLGLHQVEVSTKASPDLHPDNLSVYQQDLLEIVGGQVQHTDASHAYGKAHDALADIYEWHVMVSEAEKAVAVSAVAKAEYMGRELQRYTAGQKNRVFHGREKDVYNAAQDAMTALGARLQSKTKELEAFREKTEKAIAKEMDAPELKTPFGIAVAQGIWAHLRGLDGDNKTTVSSKRGDFVRKAIEAGDRLSVMSVLNAPAYLTGLSEEQAQTYRNHAANTWAPRESRHLRAVNSIKEKLDVGWASVMKRSTELSTTMGVVHDKEKAANRALDALKTRKAG